MFLKKSRSVFKKTWFTIFDWSKNNFDQSKQTKAHLNFFKKYRLIKKQFGSIENLEKHFLEKITWFLKTPLKALNIRNKNAWVWDEMFFQNTNFKPSFPKIKIFNHSPFENLNHKICFAQTVLKVISNLVGQTKRHTQ